ncbi:putative quinol monooxygenase [Novosphingobium sp.]|uniref:putative quinol monooxygenase n=1 Tax=Novosphingobium sp. TaxID=1874826 RepID=UPI0028ACDE7E|nr:putative quinol monooxygenase [Novosphingobium sp.]
MTSPSRANEQVACVTITIAKPGYEDRLLGALNQLVRDVRQQDGFLQYDLHRDMEEPRRFFAVENWESKQAFDAHASAPEVEAYRALVADWIEDTSYHPMKRIA